MKLSMLRVLLLTKSLLSMLVVVVLLLLRWTKPNQRSHILRWQPSGAKEATVGTAVEEAETEEVGGVVPKILKRQEAVPGPSILTCLLETSAGVECTSNTEKIHFFVVTHPRVHGKMCIPKSLQNNEKLTNSAK